MATFVPAPSLPGFRNFGLGCKDVWQFQTLSLLLPIVLGITEVLRGFQSSALMTFSDYLARLGGDTDHIAILHHQKNTRSAPPLPLSLSFPPPLLFFPSFFYPLLGEEGGEIPPR